MSHQRTHVKGRNHLSLGLLFDTRGLCLSEIVISLAAGAIVLASAFSAMNVVHTQVGQQERTLSHQQDLRLGLEVFEQEVRLATADSIGLTTSNESQFRANLNAQRTVTTSTVMPGQSVLPIENGSGWGEGKVVIVCSRQVCETHRLARMGQRSQLTLTEPVGLSFPSGSSVEVSNQVAYYAKPDEEGTYKLMRMVDGGASVLIGDLESLHLSYRDENGHMTQQPSQVKRVVLNIGSSRPLHNMIREVGLRS